MHLEPSSTQVGVWVRLALEKPSHNHRQASASARVMDQAPLLLCHVPHSIVLQFSQELRDKAWPTFKKAGGHPHQLGALDFVPTNCHINLMQVSYPKSSTSAGRTFSIRFGRKNSFFGLDPDQGRPLLLGVSSNVRLDTPVEGSNRVCWAFRNSHKVKVVHFSCFGFLINLAVVKGRIFISLPIKCFLKLWQ